jgi:uncharacterized protein (TIGR00369 family)
MRRHDPAMTPADLQAFLERAFPEVLGAERHFIVEEVSFRACRMRLLYHPRHLRPGGTISGPAMMTLADTAMYVAILGSIGPVALAVTTNLSINFLKKPEQRDLIAECRLLKLGKRLAVGEVDIHSDGYPDDLVAHVTSTYSIPPERT